LQAVAEGRLLKLPFSTIYEYLQMLRLIATILKDVGPCSMFYLAAAVSDFYVPWLSMARVSSYPCDYGYTILASEN
jgi:phosphopantothenate-cysteine ligase